MTANEIIEEIKEFKPVFARNSMGCSENWYSFIYAMKETFTLDEIREMSDRECTLLKRLAERIQEGLY